MLCSISSSYDTYDWLTALFFTDRFDCLLSLWSNTEGLELSIEDPEYSMSNKSFRQSGQSCFRTSQSLIHSSWNICLADHLSSITSSLSSKSTWQIGQISLSCLCGALMKNSSLLFLCLLINSHFVLVFIFKLSLAFSKNEFKNIGSLNFLN